MNAPTTDNDELTSGVYLQIGIMSFPAEVRILRFEEIKKEFNLGK